MENIVFYVFFFAYEEIMYKFPLKLIFLVLWLHCKVARNNYNLKTFFDW
jgi:hypothetical protein